MEFIKKGSEKGKKRIETKIKTKYRKKGKKQVVQTEQVLNKVHSAKKTDSDHF